MGVFFEHFYLVDFYLMKNCCHLEAYHLLILLHLYLCWGNHPGQISQSCGLDHKLSRQSCKKMYFFSTSTKFLFISFRFALKLTQSWTSQAAFLFVGIEKVSKELSDVETKTSIKTSSVRKLIFFLAAGLISLKFKLMVTTLGSAAKHGMNILENRWNMRSHG